MGCNMDDVEEIYKSLDYDDSGNVDIDDFCDGLLKSSADDKPGELIRIMKQCGEILHNTRQAMAILNTEYSERRGRRQDITNSFALAQLAQTSPKKDSDVKFFCA